MKRTLIIGCGGVASVAIHKCCQNSEVFEEIMIASRTKSKCDKLKEALSRTRKLQMNRMQDEKDNLAVSYVYLNMLQESQELVSSLRHLLRATRSFQTD